MARSRHISISSWFVFLPLAGVLGWCLFFEVGYALWLTSKFWHLAILFDFATLALVIGVAARLWEPDIKESTGSKEQGEEEKKENIFRVVPERIIWAFWILNVVVPTLAVLTARAIRPSYPFPTPLLRVVAALMNQL